MTTENDQEFLEMAEWVLNGEIQSLSFYYNLEFFNLTAHKKGIKINRKIFSTLEEVKDEYFRN